MINAEPVDCVIIKPSDKCKFCYRKLVIDLGSDDCDIAKTINRMNKLHIFSVIITETIWVVCVFGAKD